MLSFNFQRIFKSRGIEKPFSYLVKCGYSENFASRIANSQMRRLDLDYVEKLCELFHCTPNDLLEWIPGKNDSTNHEHPLISLKRSDKVVHLTKILSSIPLDKLDDIETIINKELNRDISS